MKLFNSLSRTGLSGFGNILLTGTAIAVATTGIALTGLYILKYTQETPEIIQLQCAVGVARADCPRYGAEMDALKTKLSDLSEKTAQAEGKLHNLRMVETAIDEVTMFASHDDPFSNYEVTVGTQYTRLVEPELSPAYFCYISLGHGQAGEQRNLHFRNADGKVIELDVQTLSEAGISAQTMEFARSVCKPIIIGQR